MVEENRITIKEVDPTLQKKTEQTLLHEGLLKNKDRVTTPTCHPQYLAVL